MKEDRWELCRDNSFIRSVRDAGGGTADELNYLPINLK